MCFLMIAMSKRANSDRGDFDPGDVTAESLFAHADGRQSDAAAAIARGTLRMLKSLNFYSLMELTLANGRRADIVAMGPKGQIWIIEIKSGLADFRADGKWPEYQNYCDRFFFAIDADFPEHVLPKEAGVIIADKYFADIMRDAPEEKLAAARRKVVTLLFARVGAGRVQMLLDREG